MPSHEQQPTGQTERRRWGNESYLDSRLASYRNEANSSKREALVSEIVSHSTERRDDMLAIFQAANTFSTFNTPESNVGMTRLSNYFLENDFVIKRLTPGYRPADEEKIQFQRTIRDVSPNLFRLLGRNDYDYKSIGVMKIFADYCQEVAKTMKGENVVANQVYPIFLTTNPNLSKAWRPSSMEAMYLGIIKQIGYTGTTFGEQLIEHVNAPYRILKAIQNVSEVCQQRQAPAVFDLYLRRFGGISLKDLVTSPYSAEESNKQIDAFLQSVPKGDYIWNVILGSTFALPMTFVAEIHTKTKVETPEENLDVSRKITSWQYHLAEQVLLPPLSRAYDYPLPTGFVPIDFSEILKRCADADAPMAAQSLFFAYAQGAETRYYLEKKQKYRHYRSEMPFSRMADTYIEYQNEDEAAMALMNRAWKTIKPQLWDSFSRVSYQPAGMMERFTYFLDTSRYRENLKKYFTGWANDYFGTDFLKVFKETESQMVEVIDHILNGTYELPGSRWGETISEIEVNMSKDSLLKRLGVISSSWKFPEDLHDNIPFILNIVRSDTDISGYVNLNTKSIVFRYLNLPPELQMMDTVLKLTIASTLHDIVGRKVKKWRHGEGKKPPPKGQPPKPRGERKLPRYWYQVDSDQLIEDFYNPKPAKPHGSGQRDSVYINARTRRVPYGAKAESFIEKIYSPETPEALKSQYLEDFRKLRDGRDPLGRVLAQANPEKLTHFPAILKEELKPVVDPDGHLLYTRTWVEGHFNPRLPAGSYQSYTKLYEAVYRAHGSSLAFLDAALAHIAGFESE